MRRAAAWAARQLPSGAFTAPPLHCSSAASPLRLPLGGAGTGGNQAAQAGAGAARCVSAAAAGASRSVIRTAAPAAGRTSSGPRLPQLWPPPALPPLCRTLSTAAAASQAAAVAATARGSGWAIKSGVHPCSAPTLPPRMAASSSCGLGLRLSGSRELSSCARGASTSGRRPLAQQAAGAVTQHGPVGGHWRGFAGVSSPAGTRGIGSRGRRSAMMAAAGQKNSSQALYLVSLIVGMIGVTYAAVPLYRMFCQATGYGGTVAEGKTVEDKIRAREENPDAAVEAAALEREITISFNADVNDSMPWKFQPTQRSVKVHPGQSTLAFYTAENTSGRVITGVSTYNVTPQQAGVYFNKIQCFCFEEQKLRPGEKIDMPVFFYVDPEFATDPRMKNVNHLTLSYTFFKVTDQTVEEDAAGLASQQIPVHVPALAVA